ncbi:FkbM family methyltransferase [Lacibacter sp.]|uniref:FkbM family methyltransferase n=1 Tax=Lacibacter sp. TaxID=1915409 RepID=UPI002B4B8E2C|nr:FkbM family methyltransferase [Lacibacter sp.]HLP36085.1 FkbM family methyltransferase [Lacibacter sp.]
MNNRLKDIANDFLPPYLLRVAKRIYRGKYLAKDSLDKKMKKYLDYDHGFFVELGANDGLVQSNTYYYEQQKSWKGILIEPSPNKFLACKANRAKRNAFFCAACVSFGFQEEFVKIAYSDYMSAPLNLESDIADPLAHAKAGEKYLPEHEQVFEFGAKAVPLNSLLSQAAAPKEIDFLSLDVEGAEIEVLKGVDHTNYRFKYLLIECRDFEKLNGYLSAAGYRFLEKLSHHDYLFTGTQQ